MGFLVNGKVFENRLCVKYKGYKQDMRACDTYDTLQERPKFKDAPEGKNYRVVTEIVGNRCRTPSRQE
jgi:hypothetical protein